MLTDLGTLGGDFSSAYGVNNVGQVVGASALPTGLLPHACLWDNGAITDLNSLLPEGTGWELWQASAINDSGQIVGYGDVSGQTHAYLLNPEGPAPRGRPPSALAPGLTFVPWVPERWPSQAGEVAGGISRSGPSGVAEDPWSGMGKPYVPTAVVNSVLATAAEHAGRQETQGEGPETLDGLPRTDSVLVDV
jgi:probable HAF family extracellular repeat protein